MLVWAITLFVIVFPSMSNSQKGQSTETPEVPRNNHQVVTDLTHGAQDDFLNGRYKDARNKLKQAISLSPNDPSLWTYLGLTEERLDSLDAAIADFRKVILISPQNAQALFSLGRIYASKGDTSRAIDMYRQGLALSPDDSPANQNYAVLLMDIGKFDEAVGPLLRLRRLNESDLPARATLIECYLKAGRRDEGKRDLQEFLMLPYATAADKLRLAKLLVEDKFSDLAQPVLARLVEEAPDLTEAHAILGSLQLNAGHYTDATRQYREAVRFAPQSAEYAMRFAECLILEKRYQDALQFLNTVPKFGNLMEYRFKKGIALYGMRQYLPAITVLDELDHKDPNLDLIQYYLARSYNEIAELEKARVYGQKAIALKPNQSQYYVILGQILRKQGDDKIDEAIATLEKALNLDPSSAPAKQELALCYENKRDYANAERLLREVVLQAPNVESGHVALSRIYYRENKKEEAEAEKRVIERIEASIDQSGGRIEGQSALTGSEDK